MSAQYSSSSRSPPPLQHPVPTHPTYIPDPPSTPVSPQGYMRFTSSPPNGGHGHQSMHHHQDAGSAMFTPAYGHGANNAYSQFQSFPSTSTHPQQQQYPQQPHAQPNFAQWGVNPATAQLGMQLGQSAVAAGQEYVQKNFGTHIPVPLLKHHFNVSNSYVIRKLQLVLFPWRNKRWTRASGPAPPSSAGANNADQAAVHWLPPRDDLNSPDLYIPVMALVTYILLAALHSGLQSRFHPEVLGRVASRALAVVLMDFMFIKTGCYFLNISGSGQVTDLVAYGGYKFVGVIATIIIGLLNASSTIYFIVFIYFFSANGFFLLRALKYVVLPDPRDTSRTLSPAQRDRRVWFLFAIALSQILYMFILVRV